MSSIEDIFIEAAFQKGYRVSDRSDVNKVLQEIHFQQSGLTEADASQLGHMLNVPAVLLVKINSAGVFSQPSGWVVNNQPQYNFTAKCLMDARLVGVESAEVLALSSYGASISTDSRNNSGPAIIFAANQLAAGLPARKLQSTMP